AVGKRIPADHRAADDAEDDATDQERTRPERPHVAHEIRLELGVVTWQVEPLCRFGSTPIDSIADRIERGDLHPAGSPAYEMVSDEVGVVPGADLALEVRVATCKHRHGHAGPGNRCEEPIELPRGRCGFRARRRGRFFGWGRRRRLRAGELQGPSGAFSRSDLADGDAPHVSVRELQGEVTRRVDLENEPAKVRAVLQLDRVRKGAGLGSWLGSLGLAPRVWGNQSGCER